MKLNEGGGPDFVHQGLPNPPCSGGMCGRSTDQERTEVDLPLKPVRQQSHFYGGSRDPKRLAHFLENFSEDLRFAVFWNWGGVDQAGIGQSSCHG